MLCDLIIGFVGLGIFMGILCLLDVVAEKTGCLDRLVKRIEEERE